LIESLREQGLKSGLVLNAWPDPPPFFDTMVFSHEVGVLKPAPRSLSMHAENSV